MPALMTVLGIAGAALIVLMYALLERKKIPADSARYFAINGLGAALVLISLAYDFDSADLGGVVLEACWIVISGMGIWKALRMKDKIK